MYICKSRSCNADCVNEIGNLILWRFVFIGVKHLHIAIVRDSAISYTTKQIIPSDLKRWGLQYAHVGYTAI